jgi:hypothetical protein
MFTAARTSTSGSNTEKLLMASYWRNMLAAAPTAQEGVVTSCEGTPQQAAKAENFADWLKREMPPGTVISDPAWWAPRIHRAVSLDLAPTTSTVSAPDEIRNAALEEAAVACFCAVANRRPVYAKDCVELIRALKRTVSAPDGANGSASE